MKKLLIALLLAIPTLTYAEKNETATAATANEAAATTTDLEGTIGDISTYAPLSDVKVIITSATNNISKTVLSDKEGKFAVGELPEGNYQVRFERDGYEPLTRSSLIVKNDKKNYFGFFLFKD